MMERAHKTTAAVVLCILLALPLLYSVILYTAAWRHRWKAVRLLEAAKSVHVGVTTQAEYESAIQPFVSSADQVREGETLQPKPDAYGIVTLPEWMSMSTTHLPAPIQEIIGKWAVVEGTLFMVIPTFKDGKLISISISEQQGHPRPFAGSVTVHAGQVQHLSPDDTQIFSGYSGRLMGGDGRVINTHVDLDDRATPEERRRALDFRFSCFTAFQLCSDGRQLLDPITSDN